MTAKHVFLIAAFFCLATNLPATETFRVATFNIENYVDVASEGRHPKPDAAKAKVRESIEASKPDVIALQEVGSTNALLELRDSLKKDGLDLPYWEHVQGHDPAVHVAVLSKFPFTARHPLTNDHFLLSGKQFSVSRGFAQVEIKVNDHYSFTLITAHLKSKRPIPEADQSELREQEAIVLREKIDAVLINNAEANLVVLGDFNDTHDSKPVKHIIGRGKHKLMDTRPTERNSDDASHANSRAITWTHFYAKEDTYSRIDYICLSHGMAREWVKEQTSILSIPNWGIASDHRPLVATFTTEDR